MADPVVAPQVETITTREAQHLVVADLVVAALQVLLVMAAVNLIAQPVGDGVAVAPEVVAPAEEDLELQVAQELVPVELIPVALAAHHSAM